ncbi:hypothetical protein D3C78_851880 [compost metagenome]
MIYRYCTLSAKFSSESIKLHSSSGNIAKIGCHQNNTVAIQLRRFLHHLIISQFIHSNDVKNRVLIMNLICYDTSSRFTTF